MPDASLTAGLCLALIIAGLSVASRRLHLASPILMLLAGIGIAFVPGAPAVVLDPELVLTLLLPPLLYSAGVTMSWRGFRDHLRPILLLAIGCVLFTTAAIAAVAHAAFGLPWAVAFVLGAIVSPPDAVAPMAMLRGVRVPRRITAVLEGESLVNDATALVALGLALTAVSTGSFSLPAAALTFIVIVSGEIVFGIAVGWLLLRLRHFANDPRAEVLLAFAIPYAAFWPPHALGGSGVVACVAAGLWVSWNGRELIRPATRLQGYFIWDLVTWGIEALVFLLTGLQARSVVAAIGTDWLPALGFALTIVATMVGVRFVWVFSATAIGRALPALRARNRMSGWRPPFLIAFTGLRGVVSLAAALSIPVAVAGAPFPDRELVLFATFVVIAVSLLGLGLPLPWLVRRLGLTRAGKLEAHGEARAEHKARLEALDAVLAALDAAAKAGASTEAVESLRRRHGDRRAHLAISSDESVDDDPVGDATALQLQLIDVERGSIGRAFDNGRITDAARRRLEREFDLEEARVRHARASARGVNDDDGETDG